LGHPGDASNFLQIFVDDFLNGVARPRDQLHERAAAKDWVSRCALHSIHALFPPPDITGHDGGRDSISIKKLNKDDARWHRTKIMLGGPGRMIGLPLGKANRYIDAISTALAQPRNFISLGDFQSATCSPAGVSTHLGSDNTPTVGWYTRMASRAKSRPPELFLRWSALRQRWTRRGPADTTHIPGKINLFGDIPSRSYDAFPNTVAGDAAFLSSFAHRFPLPRSSALGLLPT
jgi:hypothetical protein